MPQNQKNCGNSYYDSAPRSPYVYLLRVLAILGEFSSKSLGLLSDVRAVKSIGYKEEVDQKK